MKLFHPTAHVCAPCGSAETATSHARSRRAKPAEAHYPLESDWMHGTACCSGYPWDPSCVRTEAGRSPSLNLPDAPLAALAAGGDVTAPPVVWARCPVRGVVTNPRARTPSRRRSSRECGRVALSSCAGALPGPGVEPSTRAWMPGRHRSSRERNVIGPSCCVGALPGPGVELFTRAWMPGWHRSSRERNVIGPSCCVGALPGPGVEFFTRAWMPSWRRSSRECGRVAPPAVWARCPVRGVVINLRAWMPSRHRSSWEWDVNGSSSCVGASPGLGVETFTRSPSRHRTSWKGSWSTAPRLQCGLVAGPGVAISPEARAPGWRHSARGGARSPATRPLCGPGHLRGQAVDSLDRPEPWACGRIAVPECIEGRRTIRRTLQCVAGGDGAGPGSTSTRAGRRDAARSEPDTSRQVGVLTASDTPGPVANPLPLL